MVFKDGDIMLLFRKPHGLKHVSLRQVPGKGSADLGQESGWWKTLRLATGLCTMSHK